MLGGFFILEGGTFKMLPAVYKSECQYADFGYDYWYQPRHNVMISSQWGAPSAFKKGFDVKDIAAGENFLQQPLRLNRCSCFWFLQFKITALCSGNFNAWAG